MITSAENPAWRGDVPIPDHWAAGLSIPSVIRPTKIATVEANQARPIGKISPTVAAAVDAVILSYRADCGGPGRLDSFRGE